MEGEEADKHETSASKLHSENELFDVLMELGEVIQSTEAAHVACIERCIRDVTEARENCAAAGRYPLMRTAVPFMRTVMPFMLARAPFTLTAVQFLAALLTLRWQRMR